MNLINLNLENQVSEYQKFCDNIRYGGSLETAQHLYDTGMKKAVLDDNLFTNDILFRISCVGGRVDIAEWLFNTSKYSDSPIDIHQEIPFVIDTGYVQDLFSGHIFPMCCTYGKLYVAQWLITLSKKLNSPIDIHYNNEEAFLGACDFGHIDMAKWLWFLSLEQMDEINITIQNHKAFRNSCFYGRTEVAKWLWKLYSEENYQLNISVDDLQNMFELACCVKGDIEFANFLWDISITLNKPIDIHRDNEQLFQTCCYKNILEVARWLFDLSIYIKSPINIRASNDDTFKKCCEYSQYEPVLWLCELCPDYKIIHYTDEEGNKYIFKEEKYYDYGTIDTKRSKIKYEILEKNKLCLCGNEDICEVNTAQEIHL
jgi:hypothetical protein